MRIARKQLFGVCALAIVGFVLIYPAVGTGSVSIILETTIPANVDEVRIVLTDVAIRKAGLSDFVGWTDVANKTRSFAFSKFNARETLLTSQLSVGNYDGLRLSFREATIVQNKTVRKAELAINPVTVTLQSLVKGNKATAIHLRVIFDVRSAGPAAILRPVISVVP